MSSPPRGTVLRPAQAFATLAIVTAFSALAVQVLGRHPGPTTAATFALAAQCGLSLVLAFDFRYRDGVRALRLVGLGALGLLSAPVAWFFGPNSGFLGALALALLVTSVLSGYTRGAFPSAAAWILYATMALGDGAVFALVLARRLPDHSLTPVLVGAHPDWHHALAHVFVQGIFLACVLAGRAIARRYETLGASLEESGRVRAQHLALALEARAEYARTLEASRRGVLSERVLDGYVLGELKGRDANQELYEAVDPKGERTVLGIDSVLLQEAPSDRERTDKETDALEDSSSGAFGREPTGLGASFGEGTELDADALGAHDRVVLEGSALESDSFLSDSGEQDGTAREGTALEGTALEGTALDPSVLDEPSSASFSRALRVRRRDGTLRQWVDANGALTPSELRELVVHLGEALSTLHARGLTHLAVDPDHVRRQGERWILKSDRTPVKESYLAPEQLRGTGDARTDVHAAAAVIAFAATGRDAFAGAADVMGPRRALGGALSEPLARGLAQKAADRFASAAELASAVLAALDDGSRASLPDVGARRGPAEPPTKALVRPAPRPEEDDVPPPRAAPRELSSGASHGDPASAEGEHARDDAYREKQRAFSVGITWVCVGGAAILLVVADDPLPMVIAISAMLGIMTAAWTHYLRVASGARAGYGAWIVAAALSVGPAYSIGLHCAIAMVIVLWLFSGGVLQGHTRHRRIWVLLAIVLSHSALFALVWAGVLPDAGNVPIFVQGARPFEPAALHALLMGVYALAFAAGHYIERGHEVLVERSEAAIGEIAQREVELAAARNELDLALAQANGIFTETEVGGYRLGPLLGRGGMGEVYAATDPATGAPVALKLIRGDRVSVARSLELFRQECAAMAKIDSRYVARVLGYGDGTSGLPFLAMERVEGRPLSTILRERTRIELDEAASMIQQIAHGLTDVHAAGVVHCDLKPSNVLLTTDGDWKLVDFGVARAGIQLGSRSLAGTPAYMAPEQCVYDREIDARTDLYAFSLVIYRALVGRPAFTSNDPAEAFVIATEVGPPDPRPELDGPLALALRIGLAADPAARYETADELARAFASAFRGTLDADLRERAMSLPWAEAK